jgi:putative membrane protein
VSMRRTLARKFLNDTEREQIQACVREVEATTSGEIVPMVVSTSYHYPMASMIGALILSLLISAATTFFIALSRGWGEYSSYDLWIFPAVFAVSFLLLHELIKRLPGLKRFFTTRAEMAEEVEEAALTSFYRQRLNNTRDRTGILIFISVFERLAYVLADEGINAKVETRVWEEVVEEAVTGIRRSRQAEAICQAVRRCGEIVHSNFPRKPDDTNELRDLIVED